MKKNESVAEKNPMSALDPLAEKIAEAAKESAAAMNAGTPTHQPETEVLRTSEVSVQVKQPEAGGPATVTIQEKPDAVQAAKWHNRKVFGITLGFIFALVLSSLGVATILTTAAYEYGVPGIKPQVTDTAYLHKGLDTSWWHWYDKWSFNSDSKKETIITTKGWGPTHQTNYMLVDSKGHHYVPSDKGWRRVDQ